MTHENDKQRQAFDLKIAKALQIDVPELVMPELPDIEAGKVTRLPARKHSTKPLWFALAATIVLASSIGLRWSGVFTTYDSLAEEVLAHVDHEPWALRVTDKAVSNERLLDAIPASQAVFERGAALVTYAAPCVINGKQVPHLVIQGVHGPVTILLMPEEALAEATPLEGANVHGIILPVGRGSIAIVGDREEALEPIQEDIINSVTWTT